MCPVRDRYRRYCLLNIKVHQFFYLALHALCIQNIMRMSDIKVKEVAKFINIYWETCTYADWLEIVPIILN